MLIISTIIKDNGLTLVALSRSYLEPCSRVIHPFRRYSCNSAIRFRSLFSATINIPFKRRSNTNKSFDKHIIIRCILQPCEGFSFIDDIPLVLCPPFLPLLFLLMFQKSMFENDSFLLCPFRKIVIIYVQHGELQIHLSGILGGGIIIEDHVLDTFVCFIEKFCFEFQTA